jgi:hypothetical protein
MSEWGVALFHTTSAAFRAEKLLMEAAVSVKLVPTPRQFSSNCGVALRFDWQAADRVRALLAESDVEALHPL